MREVFEKLVIEAGLELKAKKMPYTSMNGNMFAFLAPDGTWAMRLSKAERAEFLAVHTEAEVHQHGRLMKDYVAVQGLDEAERAGVWAKSVANARTLKPKKTKR